MKRVNFLISEQSICYGYTKEMSPNGGSYEQLQYFLD